MTDDVNRIRLDINGFPSEEEYVLASDHDRLIAEKNAQIHQRDNVIEKLRAELETERMRLVGCGVAALMNTEESKANRISRDNPYWSASYQDVCNMVDREIELRKELETARRVIEEQNEIVEMLENQRDDAITREWMEHEYENARLTYNAEIEELGQKDGTK